MDYKVLLVGTPHILVGGTDYTLGRTKTLAVLTVLSGPKLGPKPFSKEIWHHFILFTLVKMLNKLLSLNHKCNIER